jgi:subtilisin family serine protease
VDGTSVAAPFVAGVAGLLKSEHADWSNDLIRAQMEHTAEALDVLNPGYEGLLGFGRVNAGNALTITPHPIVEMVETRVNGDPFERPMPGESATLAVTLGNDWMDALDVTGVLTTSDPYVTITQNTASFGDLPAGGTATGSPAFVFDVPLEAGYDHPIDFTLAVSAYGGVYTTEFDFTIRTRSAEELVGGIIDENTT